MAEHVFTATWIPTGVKDLERSLCCECCGKCYNEQEYAHFLLQKRAGLFKFDVGDERWAESICYKCLTSTIQRLTTGLVEIQIKHRASEFKMTLFDDGPDSS